MNKFYITTPIYYTNADPHIGHAYTTVLCDVLARWNRLKGNDTFFLTGTDEHGLKIERKAVQNKKDTQVFVDEYVSIFKDLWKKLNIDYDNFIRTTSTEHKKVVQSVLQTLYEAGDIYKGVYRGLYCVGCEQFKNEEELLNGKCPDHNIEAEIVEEECYLMKMNKWQKTLIKRIKNNEFEIKPQYYKKEMISFLERQGLKDISISRKNLKWGIPLPFDQKHVAYVWIDALLNYLTGIGWDGNVRNVLNYWPPNCQVMGKDILRVHATIWPSLLLNLGLSLPKLFIHGLILSRGKKMSKTLGNIISPYEMFKKFGSDGTRYLLLSGGSFGEDLDLTMERMIEKYNADLANGLGNLVQRTIGMINKNLDGRNPNLAIKLKKDKKVGKLIEELKFEEALKEIWQIIASADAYISEKKPWQLDNKKELNKVLGKVRNDILEISSLLTPFMPETSKKIEEVFKGPEIKIIPPLFPRIF